MKSDNIRTVAQPFLDFVQGRSVDVQLQYDLSTTFPMASLEVQRLKQWCLENIQSGNIRMRGPHTLRFGNLLKGEMRIDIVDMTGVGPGHTHPNGEINLSFSTESASTGATSFDGQTEGWLVKPPNSWHTPTVANGRMVIVYFLPKGAIQFD